MENLKMCWKQNIENVSKGYFTETKMSWWKDGNINYLNTKQIIQKLHLGKKDKETVMERGLYTTYCKVSRVGQCFFNSQ